MPTHFVLKCYKTTQSPMLQACHTFMWSTHAPLFSMASNMRKKGLQPKEHGCMMGPTAFGIGDLSQKCKHGQEHKPCFGQSRSEFAPAEEEYPLSLTKCLNIPLQLGNIARRVWCFDVVTTNCRSMLPQCPCPERLSDWWRRCCTDDT